MKIKLDRHLPGLWPGGALALGSAALFGASTPIAKLLLGAADPWMLAGLFYLGSGLGLLIVQLLRRRKPGAAESIPRKDWPWLGAAIISGGVIGPVALMFGLTLTSASSASLLLTLESVFTALIAWLVFCEHFQWRIGIGMIAITLGALWLAWPGSLSLTGLAGPLLVSAACLAWAIDNNLTRKVSLGDPSQIALLKGLAAGATNVAIAISIGVRLPNAAVVSLATIAGFLGYGVSLVLFVLALRHVGAARTGAYFATAPFMGAALAVFALGEPLTAQLLTAGALMALGVWLHLTERHAHEHVHETLAHAHMHSHDAHHQHEHGLKDPPGEPHAHWHVHAPILHTHPHYPDAHHRHTH